LLFSITNIKSRKMSFSGYDTSSSMGSPNSSLNRTGNTSLDESDYLTDFLKSSSLIQPLDESLDSEFHDLVTSAISRRRDAMVYKGALGPEESTDLGEPSPGLFASKVSQSEGGSKGVKPRRGATNSQR